MAQFTGIRPQSADQLRESSRTVTAQLTQLSRQLDRLDQESECNAYQIQTDKIAALDSEIEVKTVEFEDEQTHYIGTYFDEVNELFRGLGSGDFEIRAVASSRGNKRVIALKAQFRGVEVPQQQLPILMSESDKRNLSLALFITRVRKIPDPETRVLVFDDPVVSFDENRIQITRIELEKLARQFGHVIVLTHYSTLVRYFSQSGVDAEFLEIANVEGRFVIRVKDMKTVRFEPHQRQYEDLRFLGESGIAGTYNDLRVFLEDHLRFRFQDQLRDLSLTEAGLAQVVTELRVTNVISDQASQELFDLVNTFNDPSHSVELQVNPVEWNSLMLKMMRLLFGPMS